MKSALRQMDYIAEVEGTIDTDALKQYSPRAGTNVAGAGRVKAKNRGDQGWSSPSGGNSLELV